MLSVLELPDLRQPAVLCAVSGWSDAGSAASGALGYLLNKWENRRFAEFDPDAVYNYTVTRPATVRQRGKRRLHWPDLAWYALPMAQGQRDLVVLLGPEPDLRWRELRTAATDLIQQLGASMVITLGAFYAQVPHTGPVRMFGRAYDETLSAAIAQFNLADTDYQGPTGLVTALADAATGRGVPALGLWAAAPMYLQGTTNPKLSAALLRVAEASVGVDLGLSELDAAGRDLELRINEALRGRPDFEKLVANLGGQLEQESAPPAAEPEPEEPPIDELPTSEEVLRQLEEYLRDIRGTGEPSEDA